MLLHPVYSILLLGVILELILGPISFYIAKILTIFQIFRRGGGSPLVRTPSPRARRHLHHDIGFSDTVSNVVEIFKDEQRRGRLFGNATKNTRGIIKTQISLKYLDWY